MITNPLSNKQVFWLGLLFFFPLVLINWNAPHNWGDDFAQYIMHSRKLAAFANPYHIDYIYNSRYPVMSPPAYPIGFPLLLGPVSLFQPASLLPYKIFMQVILLALSSFTLVFLSKYFKLIVAVLISLIIYYNPFMLECKAQILSDLPFALFFLLTFYEAENKKRITVLSLYITAAILIRSAGFVLLPGLFWMVFQQWRNLQLTVFSKRTLFYGFAVLLPLASFALNQFTTNAGYTSQFKGENIHFFQANPQHQLNTLNNFCFEGFTASSWYNYLWFVLPVFTAIGFAYFCIKKHIFLVIGFTLYEALVLFFPYEYATVRFMIPVLPLLFLFIFTGIRLCFSFFHTQKIIYPVLCCLLLFEVYLLVPADIQIARNISGYDSPENPQAAELFSFIREHTASNETFLFVKPKALACFTQRKCVANDPAHDQDEINWLLNKEYCHYLVTYTKIENRPLEGFIREHPENCRLLFDNGAFKLYAFKT